MVSWIVCGVLILIVFLLLGKLYFLRKDIGELCSEFRERLLEDTNNPVYLSSKDRYVRELAAEMNHQLKSLRKQRQRYLCGDRELKEAVTNISHDLRTPLTAIYGYLNLLKDEETSQNVKKYLECIENRADAMKTLTEELFRYSILVSEEEEKVTDVSVNGILEECLAAFYGELMQRGIEPEISITEQEVRRKLDGTALRRIFDNIMSNALKYSAGDLQVSLSRDGNVQFSNEAAGLTPVMVERLFDRFYTVETGRNSTGLGLSIARLLTERMGGSIHASCEEGRLTLELFFPESCRPSHSNA